jgi:SAM-dependent methyltransferase
VRLAVPTGGFELPLREPYPVPADPAQHWLVHADGRRSTLPVRRWHGPPEPALRPVLARCVGPTIDLGCGPGRLVAALAQRGLVTLGVDISADAVRLTRIRGASALRRDLFQPLPGEGRWAHALLIDGNIGIGGDPGALLRRCAGLIAGRGTVLVEFEPPGVGLWQGHAQVASGPPRAAILAGPPFRWARVGVDAAQRVAAEAGLRLRDVSRIENRWFAELRRR